MDSCSGKAFSYEAETGFKNYEIIKESYSVEGATGYGTKPVIKATESGKDRFYVMALSDFTTTYDTVFYWYYTLYGSANTLRTANTFGSGKQNTVNMISDWIADTDGQNSRDLWGVIQDKVEDGWFVPSIAECYAFGYALDLANTNSESCFESFWSSTLDSTTRVALAVFSAYGMETGHINDYFSVRLATTF